MKDIRRKGGKVDRELSDYPNHFQIWFSDLNCPPLNRSLRGGLPLCRNVQRRLFYFIFQGVQKVLIITWVCQGRHFLIPSHEFMRFPHSSERGGKKSSLLSLFWWVFFSYRCIYMHSMIDSRCKFIHYQLPWIRKELKLNDQHHRCCQDNQVPNFDVTKKDWLLQQRTQEATVHWVNLLVLRAQHC